MKKKIVYLHHYPPEVEKRQYPLLPDLIDKLSDEFKVFYVGFETVLPIDFELRGKIEFIKLPFKIDTASTIDKILKTILFYLLLPRLFIKLKRIKPDIVLCKEPLPFLPSLCCIYGLPTIIASVNDCWWQILLGWYKAGRKLASFFERLEAKIWNKKCLCVIAENKIEAQILERRGVSLQKIRITPTTSLDEEYVSYDTPDVHKLREQLGLNDNNWVVAIHGTIRPGKGYGQLLKWWKEICKEHPLWRLLIIGGLGGLVWCKREIKKLGIEKYIVMTGWLPTHSDVVLHLNVADCLLTVRANTPDNFALIPSVLFHNMTIGKPHVAVGLPGISEVVRDRVDGYLYKPDDFESFKNVLEYVFNNPDEAKKIGENASARAYECFGHDKILYGLLSIINEFSS